ncbi:MAG: hypothetical protein JWM78_1637 [Verrucomicrobiaceae bacterium]|nr:hypothetical protein [Verrucomicrobiaceae bacterium]
MTSQAQTKPPRLGEHWPEQGGIFIALCPGQNGQPDYHLIAPTDPRALLINVKWGKRGKDILGARSDWDGVANTHAMAENGSDLAQKIMALDIDGHRDLYLPARHELRLIKLVAPQLIVDDWHWSSTQYSASPRGFRTSMLAASSSSSRAASFALAQSADSSVLH